MEGFKCFEEIFGLLDGDNPRKLDLAKLCSFLENVRIQGFQKPHYAQIEELFRCLQEFPNPELLLFDNFFGALAKLYDTLVTEDFNRLEVLSLNLRLLFVIEDLSEYPEGKVLCGKHFITRILALISSKAGSLKLKRASVETLCALVTRSAENQKFLVVHASGCYKLFKVFLPRCGDFQLQATASEILFRLTRKHRRLLDVIADDNARRAMLSLHDMERPDLISEIRKFVGLLNMSMGTLRSVHSFRVLEIISDGHQDDSQKEEERWIDIGSDHISYYTAPTSKDSAGIVDLYFKDIKEIKLYPSSYLELVICKTQRNAAVLARTAVRFRFASEDISMAYECCMARLKASSGTLKSNHLSSPSWIGKTSIGISVPLPKASDFPIMPTLAPSKVAADDREKDVPSPALPVQTPAVVPIEIPEAAEKFGVTSGKENVGQLRSKLSAIFGTPKQKPKSIQEPLVTKDSKEAVSDQHNREDHNSDAVRKEDVPSLGTTFCTFKDKQKTANQENDANKTNIVAVPVNNCFKIPNPKTDSITATGKENVGLRRNLSAILGTRQKTKLKSGTRGQAANLKTRRTRVKSKSVVPGTENSNMAAINEKENICPPKKLAATSGTPTSTGSKNELNLKMESTRKISEDVNAERTLFTKAFPKENICPPKKLAATSGTPTSTGSKNELNLKMESTKKVSEYVNTEPTLFTRPFPRLRKRKPSGTAKISDVRTSENFQHIDDAHEASPVFPASRAEKMPDFRNPSSPKMEGTGNGNFRFDGVSGTPRRSQRKVKLDSETRYTAANCIITDSPELVEANETAFPYRLKRRRVKRRENDSDPAESPVPIGYETGNVCADAEVESIFLLFANLLKKFKQKVEFQVRAKTIQILNQTSEQIKSEARTVESQIQKDTDDYVQQCTNKFGQIEGQLHDKTLKFKEVFENFTHEFRQHCQLLEEIQAEVEWTEDELKAISDKQKLAHRKMISQVQKTSEECLAEAESKILAAKKAAKCIRDALQESIVDAAGEDEFS